jgi:hypothetical protein
LATAAWVAASLATVFTGDALPNVGLAGAGLAGGATDFAGCEPEASGGDLAAGAPDFAGCEPEALGGDLAGGVPDCEPKALATWLVAALTLLAASWRPWEATWLAAPRVT